ncbi:hypothetical protein EJB05_12646, partial [Eragrostis curvula]
MLRLPRPLPVLALPDGTIYNFPDGKPLHFPGLDCAGFKTACGSWLVFLREDDCFLVDPFAGTTVTLPALSRVRLIPPDAVPTYVQFGTMIMFHPFATWLHIIQPNKTPVMNKLILCSPNLVAALAGSTISSAGQNSQIIVCKPGAASWSVLANEKCQVFEDMAFYRGKLYVIAQDENLLVVNIGEDLSTGDPQVSQVEQVIKEAGSELVAGQSEFEVFKADLEQSQWIKVTTLGDDQMLFLGRPCSRSVSTSRFGMPGDKIFFLDDIRENAFVEYTFEEEITYVSAYNMRTGEVSSPLPMVWDRKMIPAAWLFPCD